MITKASQKKLTELRNSGNWCCLEIRSDYMYVWDISLTRGYQREGDHTPCVFSGSCEDLNDAVDRIYDRAAEYLAKEDKNDT